MDRPYKFAIVGGGLTATSMLCQFVEKAAVRVKAGKLDPRVVALSLFEKTDEFGPGFPHNHRYLLPFHITNMCAADMGVYADRPGDFQRWVDRNLDRLSIRFDDFPADVLGSANGHGPCNHYPRAFMGVYLHTRFHQAVKVARSHGITVALYPRHEITDVRQEGGKARLDVSLPSPGGRTQVVVDAVLLATGHWFSERRQKNYFDSPWPAKKLLDGIPPGAALAIMGTSLSAIEAVLTLTSDGCFVGDPGARLSYIPSSQPRRITLYSRSGLLPKVRGKVGAHVNQFITPSALKKIRYQNNGRLTLTATFELLNAELEAIYGRPVDWLELLRPAGCPAEILTHYLKAARIGDGPEGSVIWQTVLYQTFPHIRQWYLALGDTERKHFDRNYTSAFFSHAATQPRINAAKLLALINAGLVKIVRLGKRYRFYRDDNQDHYCFDYTDRNGHARLETYPYVVDARGQPRSLTTDPSELAQNLIASISAQRHEKSAPKDRDAIRIDPTTHRVVVPDFGPKAAVYAVGAMTRGQIIDASMANAIAGSTLTIADNLLHMLSRRR